MLKFFVSAVCLSFMVSAATASASDMGAIKPVLELGEFGPWTQKNDGRFFVMKNDSSKNAIKYYTLPHKQSEIGKRRIHVDIEFRKSGEATHGGIIFGHTPASNTYYLFTLSEEGRITLMQKSQEGSKILFKGDGKNIKEGRNTLSCAERGKHIHLAVNGESGLGSDTFDLGDGALGIAAWGTGEFAFTKFREYAAVPDNADISDMLRPDKKGRFSAKDVCKLPDLGAPIAELTVAAQTPRLLDLPPQNMFVMGDLMSEGKGDDGAGNLSMRALPRLPGNGIEDPHICSSIETQRVKIQDAGTRTGTIGLRLLPEVDLAAAYPSFGASVEKSGRMVRTKPKRFAAFKTFKNDDAQLRKALADNPMIDEKSSFWSIPGWTLVPLKRDAS